MASVMQGDAYSIPVTIKSGNGTPITPEIAACVEITVGQFAKRWPGQVTFDEKTGEWKFPMTQNQTFRFTPGAAVVQARVVFQDGSIMGGSGAPMRVEQSASRGTLPQPEKTETTTGSTPKATEVTIPTVHDINVSLHSQVILSDPIKAPYIGDNGNWYEYDAATGEFVDTGVKAGGGGSEEWELINEITLSETVNEVVIDIDSDGNPLALRLAKVECVIQIDESDPFTYIKIRCNDNTVSTNTLSNIKSGTCYFSGLYVHMGPAGIMSAVLSAVLVQNYNWKYSIEKMGFHYNSDWKSTAINRLTVSPNDGQKPLGVAGTKIYVYGVRA